MAQRRGWPPDTTLRSMKAKRAQPLRFFENLPANVALPLAPSLSNSASTPEPHTKIGKRCSTYTPFCSGFVRSSPSNAIFLESMYPRRISRKLQPGVSYVRDTCEIFKKKKKRNYTYATSYVVFRTSGRIFEGLIVCTAR